MVSKLDEIQKKFDAWESADLSTEEMSYYIEVSARIEKKLLKLI